MATLDDDRELTSALEELKALAMSPVQPGESPDWRAALRVAAQHVARAMSETAAVRQELLSEAIDEAPAMRSLVDQLRDDEAAVTRELQAIIGGVVAADGAARQEHSASSEHERVLELREPLMAWVDKARAHVRDVRSLQVEALYRDRGVVD